MKRNRDERRNTWTAGATLHRTYTSSAGAATIYIELYDSLTRVILARAPDKQAAQSVGGYLSYFNCVTNTADAPRMLGTWAELLRDGLDELHGK